MNTTFDVLVIVLSVLLGLFLVISVITAVIVLKLVKTIRRIVARGEHLIDSAEAATELFKSAAGPAGALRSLVHIVETVTKHKKKGA